MAWDETQPTDITKIRNIGTVIRANWNAIEKAESNFKAHAVNLPNRNNVVPNIDNEPPVLPDTSILYVEEDADANPELFVKDGSDNIVQLSQDGKLGGKTTDAYVESISFDGGTSEMNGIHQVSGWARVTGTTGAIVAGSGDLTIVRISAGVYTIGFVVAPLTSNFVGLATGATDARRSFRITTYTATTCRVYVLDSSDNPKDTDFQVVVFGGR